jgi:hypothetical protein
MVNERVIGEAVAAAIKITSRLLGERIGLAIEVTPQPDHQLLRDDGWCH